MSQQEPPTHPLDAEALSQIIRIFNSRDVLVELKMPPGTISLDALPLAMEILLERNGIEIGPEYICRDGEPLYGRWRGGNPPENGPISESVAFQRIADILRRAGADWPGDEVEGEQRLFPALQSLFDHRGEKTREAIRQIEAKDSSRAS